MLAAVIMMQVIQGTMDAGIDNTIAYDALADIFDQAMTAIATLLGYLWEYLVLGVMEAILNQTFGSSYAGAGWAVACVLFVTLCGFYVARHNGYLDDFKIFR